MKTTGNDRRKLWLIAGLALALGLVVGAARADAQIACVPSTTPCQTCPPPPPCTPSNTPCAGLGTTTFTTSTVTCAGSFAQETTTAATNTVGPANICVGPNKSVGCLVPAGTVNINVNTDIITAVVGVVAIPTLSVWAFGLLAVLLGAFALRRLRGLRPT